MNDVLGKKGYWGYYRFEQLVLLYLFDLRIFLISTASRNRQLSNLRTAGMLYLRLDTPIMFLKVSSSL